MKDDHELEQVCAYCPGFSAETEGLGSIYLSNKKGSCRNCRHYSEEKCGLNIYDTILYNMDKN